MRIVVPFSAGSGTDTTMRVFADAFRAATGRTVVVENRAGGGTVIGALEVSRAAPNGETILFNTGGHTTNAVLMKKLPFDPVNSFTPVMMLARGSGFVLAVAATSRFKTLQEVLEAARAEPGRLTYGSSGVGNSTHVMAALFCRAAGIEMTHVPYKGTPINDLLAGMIDTTFQGASTIMPYLKSGRMRALGIGGQKRIVQLPDTPTFSELGIQADLPGWTGFFAPPKMPPQVLQALHDDLLKASRVPAFETYSRDSGAELVRMPPADFRSFLLHEIEGHRKNLLPLGIQMD